jgi:hypothetical protein
MSDKAACQKARSPEGCDENGPAPALLLGHVSIQICSFVAPCRRPILMSTPAAWSPCSLTGCAMARSQRRAEFLSVRSTHVPRLAGCLDAPIAKEAQVKFPQRKPLRVKRSDAVWCLRRRQGRCGPSRLPGPTNWLQGKENQNVRSRRRFD